MSLLAHSKLRNNLGENPGMLSQRYLQLLEEIYPYNRTAVPEQANTNTLLKDTLTKEPLFCSNKVVIIVTQEACI